MKWSKMLIWVGLGALIWSLSLLWPEINLALTPQMMAKLVLALGIIMLAYTLGYYRRPSDPGQLSSDQVKQKHSSRPSRPVPPLSPA